MGLPDAAARGRDMFHEDLTRHLKPMVGLNVEITWLEPDPKAGCVRFGLSDGRVGDVRPGADGGWRNATIYVSG